MMHKDSIQKFKTMPDSKKDGRGRLTLEYPTHSLELGIEIGSLETFFSFENSKLGTSRIEQEFFKGNGADNWKYGCHIQFSDAHIKVLEEGHADRFHGQRTLEIEALDNSRLMDSVLRFVITKDQVQSAFIGDREIIHERLNRYHQYPLDQVTFRLKSRVTMAFHPIPFSLPSGFKHVVYLRDEPDKWILHIRALALNPSHYVLKGCTRWYNKALPPALQRIVLSSTWLRSRLLYIRERISQRIPIQVNGAANLSKGGLIKLGVYWSCRYDAL